MPINSLMRDFALTEALTTNGRAGPGQTMPKSADASDRNFGSIEVVIKETARGRAFLAEYARRVRDSDTLTLLAMVRRLERVCQDLSVRRTDLDKNDVESEGRAVENSNGLTGTCDLDEMEQVATVRFADVDQNRETLARIAHLVDALRYSERVAANLTDHEVGIVPETSLSKSLSKNGGIDVGSAERDGKQGPFPGSPDCRKVRSQQDVLDDIAKALGTSA